MRIFNTQCDLKKYFKVSKDVLYSFLAMAVSIGVMQIVVYPYLGRVFSPEEYGDMLTILGLLTIVVHTFGNELARTRLINNNLYQKPIKNTDFNLLLVIGCIFSAILSFVFLFGKMISVTNKIMLIIYVLLSVFRGYYIITFRVYIDLKKNFMCNIFCALGYVVGIVCFCFFKFWPMIFIFGEVFALIYILKNTNFHKESFSKTAMFHKVLQTYIFLIVSGLVGNLSTYLDRIVLNPMLGGDAVSTFYVASFLVKSLTFMVAPITGVLLTYISSDNKYSINKKQYGLFNIVIISVGCCVFWGLFPIIKIITGYLYPALINGALPYLFVASMASFIGILALFPSTITLRFAPAYWQTVLSVFNLGAYLLLGVTLLHYDGLMGFCYAVLITNVLKFVVSFLVGYIYLK